MTALTFVHTSDLHLGKPFGGYGEADRLRVARRQSIAGLIAVARAEDARHVLIAGDLFDVPNPAPATWRQAVAEMSEATELTWWLLPGNHDNLREAAATWEAISALGHANLRVLTEPVPQEMQPGGILLPAPLTTRRPASDPTGWMDGAVRPEGVIVIGLAHGPVQGFGAEEDGGEIIAPDRDRRAGLDYLALGDWHGQMRISPRVQYSGTPESDRFKHDGRGSCLVVRIEAPGAAPEVRAVETGHFDWRLLTLSLVPGLDAAAKLEAALPEGPRRDCLLRVEVAGRTSLAEASALAAAADRLAPEFCHFDMRTDGLSLEIEAADLDAIATSGALRQAGDALAAEAADPALGQRDRAIAEAALRRLHALVAEEGA